MTMICETCGVEAPTKYVEFYQNIGAIVIRFHKSVKGDLCKTCISKYFWEFTMINFALGWWGMISFFITPFLILNNVIRYLASLGLPPVPEGATYPRLTDDAIDRIEPHADEIFRRIDDGEKVETIAAEIGPRADVTPGQVWLYVGAVLRDQERRGR